MKSCDSPKITVRILLLRDTGDPSSYGIPYILDKKKAGH
ncbi:hypothetical protein TNIN_83471, partial [Trichonephila inaurata madagascariensis]